MLEGGGKNAIVCQVSSCLQIGLKQTVMVAD